MEREERGKGLCRDVLGPGRGVVEQTVERVGPDRLDQQGLAFGRGGMETIGSVGRVRMRQVGTRDEGDPSSCPAAAVRTARPKPISASRVTPGSSDPGASLGHSQVPATTSFGGDENSGPRNHMGIRVVQLIAKGTESTK